MWVGERWGSILSTQYVSTLNNVILVYYSLCWGVYDQLGQISLKYLILLWEISERLYLKWGIPVYLVCYILFPKMLGDVVFKFREISKYNCNLSPSIKSMKLCQLVHLSKSQSQFRIYVVETSNPISTPLFGLFVIYNFR